MKIKTKDELFKIIEDISSRLALVEEADTKAEPEEQHENEAETQGVSGSDTSEGSEVETEDEIEKFLNS